MQIHRVMRSFLFLLWISGSVLAFRKRARNLFSAAVASSGKGDDSTWLNGMELESDYPKQQEEDNSNPAVLDYLQLHPLLQVPMSVSLQGSDDEKPVRVFCDTGAQRTIMSWDCARANGLLHHLDQRYAGHATGVGSCRVLGRIPAGICRLNFHGTVSLPSPAITILESTGTQGVEFLIGLDFLREYGAVLNLRDEEMVLRVEGKEHHIPFIRPRSRLSKETSSYSATSFGIDSETTGQSDVWLDDDLEDVYDDSSDPLDMSGV